MNQKLTSAGVEPEKEVGTRTGAYYIQKLTWEVERDHFQLSLRKESQMDNGRCLRKEKGENMAGRGQQFIPF